MSCQMSGRSGCHGWDKQENKRQSGCNVVCVIVQSIEEKQKHFFAFCTFFHFFFLRFLFFSPLDKQEKKRQSGCKRVSALNDNMGANVNRKYSCTCKCFIC